MRAGDVKWPIQGHVLSFNGGAGTHCPQRRFWFSLVIIRWDQVGTDFCPSVSVMLMIGQKNKQKPKQIKH